jgi:hypothetical protein
MEQTCRNAQNWRANSAPAGGAALLLLVLGLYLPTSVNSNFSKVLFGLNFGVAILVFVTFLFRKGSLASFPACVSAMMIVPLLVVFTALSTLHEKAYGAMLMYGTLSLMLMLNLKTFEVPQWIDSIFVIVGLVNIAVGIAILLGSRPVDDFIIRYYTVTTEYSELVPNMLALRKPILSFGTHSLAGFILYLFFYVSWQAYVLRGRWIFLMIAFGYLFLTGALLSWTGVVLAAVGWVQMIVHFWRRLAHKWLWSLALAGVGLIVAAFPFAHIAAKKTLEGAEGVATLLAFSGGGFAGRLLPGGTLFDDIQYIKAHPFVPAGFSNSPALLFVDSGWVEYTLRGSVILVLLIYGSLFAFLKRSLRDRGHCLWLFFTILAFELGYTSLVYYRGLCLLPFFIIFLNRMQSSSKIDAHRSPGNQAAVA